MVSIAAVLILSGGASATLNSHVDALKGATEFSASYRIQQVGGGSESYAVTFAKPNQARIDTPENTIVADGKTITIFVKGEKAFYKKEQSEGSINEVLTGQNLMIWAPFFSPDALNGISNLKDGPAKRGLKTATGMFNKNTKVEFFIDPANGLAKQVLFEEGGVSEKKTIILNTTSVQLSKGGETFAFTAPAGVKETTEDALLGDKWVSFSEALGKAKSGNKLVMVDFMADWCVPCKMMDKEVFQSDAFKKATKGMVLAKVDGDKQTDIAQRYSIEAYPTVKFLKADGSVVHEFVGYGGPQQVLAEIATARKKAGI